MSEVRQVVRGHPLAWTVAVAATAGAVAVLVVVDPPTTLALALVVIAAVIIAIAPFGLPADRGQDGRGGGTSSRSGAGRPDLRELEAELDALEDPRPSYQLQAIGEKRDNLVAILARRMEAGELTFARYRASAQQVYEAVVSNLREVSIASRAVSAIDLAYVDARLSALADEGGNASKGEVDSLRDRRALASAQEAKISFLLAQNELAMTLLDRTSTALADAAIGVASQDADAALAALAELADRAARYADP